MFAKVRAVPGFPSIKIDLVPSAKELALAGENFLILPSINLLPILELGSAAIAFAFAVIAGQTVAGYEYVIFTCSFRVGARYEIKASSNKDTITELYLELAKYFLIMTNSSSGTSLRLRPAGSARTTKASTEINCSETQPRLVVPS